MPWNDNANPGPWGSPPPSGDDDDKRTNPPKGPNEPSRGQDHRRPPPSPAPGRGPRLPGWAERLQEDLERLLGRRGGLGGPGGLRGNIVGIVLAAAFMLWMVFGSLYIVQVNEEGVVTRFGAYDRTAGPGLHLHLPWPIEGAEMVAVTTQNKTTVGGNTPDNGESLMLTGDENIVDLDFIVLWHVTDAPKYLFNVSHPDDAVKAVAESAMREVVGRSDLHGILTNGRGQVQTQALALTQQILDSYHSGITIDAIQVQNAAPPPAVIPAFQDLNTATQDQQAAIYAAQAYQNKVVNEAKGDAAKMVREAEGYREQMILRAQGEAAAFNSVYDQYRRAPAVTRQRLYTETMEFVLQHSNKVVIDAKGSTAPIILPPDVFRARAPDAAPAPPPAPPPQVQVQPQPQGGGQ